jgi:Uma2 family endonuclease
MTALRKPVGMTVAEFQAWQPEEHPERRWQLFDGEPVCMAPASENHGAVQSEVVFLLTGHLRDRRPACRVITAPGVVPRVRSATNHRIPDLGVTCSPPPAGRSSPIRCC